MVSDQLIERDRMWSKKYKWDFDWHFRYRLLCLRFQGSLCGCIQSRWLLQISHWKWKGDMLSERYWHIGRRRHSHWRFTWQSFSCCMLFAWGCSTIGIWVSSCQGASKVAMEKATANTNELSIIVFLVEIKQVSRCCGLKITSEGYVVTLAKNNHHVLVLNTLYIQWLTVPINNKEAIVNTNTTAVSSVVDVCHRQQ